MTWHITSSLNKAQLTTTVNKGNTSRVMIAVLVLQALFTAILATESDRQENHMVGTSPALTTMPALSQSGIVANRTDYCAYSSCEVCSTSDDEYCYECSDGYYLEDNICKSCGNAFCQYCTNKGGYCAKCVWYTTDINSPGQCGFDLRICIPGLIVLFFIGFCCNECGNEFCYRFEYKPKQNNKSDDSQLSITENSAFESLPKEPEASPPSTTQPAVVRGRPTFSPGMANPPNIAEGLKVPLLTNEPPNRYAPPPKFEYIAVGESKKVPTYEYPRASS
jgi:hypothetical protein